MENNSLLKRAIILSMALLGISGVVCPQEQSETSAAGTTHPYANNSQGLRLLLEDMRKAAKEGDDQKLVAFLKDTEIPNCDAWLHKMYESDKADSWMGLCNAKTLDSKEKSMSQSFEHYAKENGKILIRKVNDNPQPGKGMEWGWLQAIKLPLDIYWAGWLPVTESKESEADPIGYFMFINGGFRWESGIESFKRSQVKISNAKIIQPKLIQKVDPIYPPEAATQHIVGTVRVYYVIGGDGLVYNAHAISDDGLSNDPWLRKAAEEAVMKWRYQPGTWDGKPFQTSVTVDIKFQ